MFRVYLEYLGSCKLSHLYGSYVHFVIHKYMIWYKYPFNTFQQEWSAEKNYPIDLASRNNIYMVTSTFERAYLIFYNEVYFKTSWLKGVIQLHKLLFCEEYYMLFFGTNKLKKNSAT